MAETAVKSELSPPAVHPGRGPYPVLLSVPHSGRDYPDWLVAMASGGRRALSVLEDPLVDRLIWRAQGHGIGAVIAKAPRAAVDCNRAEDEIDPSVVDGAGHLRPSARARGGLGIVPGRTLHDGYLWRRSIGRGQLEERIAQAHRPFHEAIEAGLSFLVERFGGAILIDCHSMPPPADGVPPIIFGDCHGRTASPWVTALAMRLARDSGFGSGLNNPFAGGHVIERHGKPRREVHAVQLEIDRRCYLADGGDPGPEFDRVALLIERLATGLGQALLDRQLPLAAE